MQAPQGRNLSLLLTSVSSAPKTATGLLLIHICTDRQIDIDIDIDMDIDI